MPATPNPLIDIRPDHWAIVHDILQKHVPQYEVWAFGSRAKWTTKEYSDLDLAVITDKPLSLSVSAALSDDLSESDLPWKVDIVDWATTSESFRKIIERDKVVVQKAKTGRAMAGEWRRKTLDQLGRIITGKTPPSSHSNAFGGAIPFVTPSDMDGRRTIKHTARTLTESGAATVRGACVPANAVMVSCIGSDMGKAAIAGSECVTNQQINSIVIETGDSPVYVYYDLSARKAEIRGAASGSAQPILNKSAFGRFGIELPPPDEQRAVAHILGTLDDKIELNRRMNETLEAIARAIFKSWFVDFDPVRAKASGEPPDSICRRLGLTPDLLALFPDRLVDSELGEIPEGWEVKSLDGIADYLNGLALQKFPPENDSEWLPVIKISQLKKGDSIGADRASHKLKREYIVDDGDVLFSWSGSLEVDIWCGGRGALNQHLFKVTSANYPKWFYFFWTKHHLPHFQAIAAGKAVTMGHIQRKHLTEALCAVPQKPILERLDSIMAPLLDKQIENRKASSTLALVRDALLPKLLSGELRVPEIESSLEAMT